MGNAPLTQASALEAAQARHRAGDLAGAVSDYEALVGLAPDYWEARESLAFALYAQQRFAEAAEQFAEVARLRPESAAAHSNLGALLWQLDRRGDALAAWDRALAIDPHRQDALFNSAQALGYLGRPLDAIDRMRSLLLLRPAPASTYFHAGMLFHSQGLREEALQAFADALARDSDHGRARWMQAITELPLAYGPHESPEGAVDRFATALQRLDEWFDASREAQGASAVAVRQPFYLAFHEVDVRDPMSRYGDLCARLMRSASPPAAQVRTRSRVGAPVSVAVVSAYFYDHSVWTAVMRGFCAQVDRGRVRMHVFHTGTQHDAETDLARASAASFFGGPRDLDQWVAAIRSVDPDVVLYPEIGMDATSARLASMRLAPSQVVAWGHPQTSGLPTIDYFLSAQGFEPPDGASHYRERLVALPNLGCYYDELRPDFAVPEGFSGNDGVPYIICAGTPYKYTPRHDALLIDIARELGACRFLFFIDVAPLLSRKIEERMALAFRRAGLDPRDHIRFLPRQSRPAFFELMRGADVYLDTLGFSGFNTAMQAIECGLPVVACEGRFARGRLASGILRTIGMDELVASTPSDYVGTAVRLCADIGHRTAVGSRIAQRRGAALRDLAPVRALEDFLESIATGHTPEGSRRGA
ncbi:MAG TPA: tetratricopeptide repeat protein [Casimicrobiaceae bacterium]|nr:tetratricopeptide repeat protein [Casimicrobiaceae bacterium]